MKAPARAVFLDRDGVINAPEVRDGKPYPPQRAEDFHLLPGVKEACDRLHNAGFLLVVVTNQPDVGRGQLDVSIVEKIHQTMCQLLPIDRVEVCFDASDQASAFRKPEPGMLYRAASELDIDLSKSYMVGDRWRDVDCGRAAGCTTIFVDRGYQEHLRQQPHFKVKNLSEAASIVLANSGGL
jgi:D-glycero-D-manno-heptose 1,7-bisphosphate phosphatase